MNLHLRLLRIDFLQKLLGISCFTLFVAAIYKETGKSSDIGWISLATFLPSLMMMIFAGTLTARLTALGLLRWFSVARSVLFAAVAIVHPGAHWLLIAAAIQSLIHQGSVSAKMSLDAVVIMPEARTSYLSQKTMFGNIAMVAAPALGGSLISLFDLSLVFAVMAVAATALSILVFIFPTETLRIPAKNVGKDVSILHSLRHLMSIPHTAGIVLVFCLVAIILEVQAPLLFPFVKEVYEKSSAFTGLLLGLAGVGGVLGSFLAQKWQTVLNQKIIPPLIILDGATFFLFTQMSSPLFASVVFVLLGIMGAVTLIVVEGAIQQDVQTQHQPFVFSAMQFAGGAGGASLGVVAGFLAEAHGAKVVLASAAILEVFVGVLLVSAGIFIVSRFQNKQPKGTL